MKQLILAITVITFVLVFTEQDVSLQVSSKKDALKFLTDYRFKVNVGITCQDRNTKTLVESYIKRELRDFKDVDIVSLKPSHQLNILLTEPTFTTTGSKTGQVIIAVNYLIPVYWENIFDTTKYSDAQKDFLKTMPAGLCYSPPELALYTDDRNELRDLCQNIIADFDIRILEKQRLATNELKKILKE